MALDSSAPVFPAWEYLTNMAPLRMRDLVPPSVLWPNAPDPQVLAQGAPRCLLAHLRCCFESIGLNTCLEDLGAVGNSVNGCGRKTSTGEDTALVSKG